MSQLKLSKDCILDKTVYAFKSALLQGEYVIAFDVNPKIVLENVFHYNPRTKSLEIFTLSPNEDGEHYNLHFDAAIRTDKLKELSHIAALEATLKGYDKFAIDKHNNLNTGEGEIY